MTDGSREIAQEQIEQVDLPATVYRTVRRLLDQAARANGTLILGEAQLMAICQTAAAATMRSHLVQLAGAGIIHYQRRGSTVTIQFSAWANPELPWPDDPNLIAERSECDADRAKVIAQRSNRALSDQNGASADEKFDRSAIKSRAQRSNRALSDQNGDDSLTRPRARALVGRLVDPSPNESRVETHPPTPTPSKPKRGHRNGRASPPPPPPIDAHQQLALDLLIDTEIGLTYELAEILARKLPPQQIYRAVDDWLPDRRAGKVKAGALAHRLKKMKASRAAAVTLSADFRQSDLYRRYPLPTEMIADPERRNYRPKEYADYIRG
jgi:hypothetical protein